MPVLLEQHKPEGQNILPIPLWDAEADGVPLPPVPPGQDSGPGARRIWPMVLTGRSKLMSQVILQIP